MDIINKPADEQGIHHNQQAKLITWLIEISQQLLSWLTPQHCNMCGVTLIETNYSANSLNNGFCCSDCYIDLPFIINACERCGKAIPHDNDVCGNCISSPPPFDRCFCAFMYQVPIDHLIRQFKYAERPDLSATIAQLFYTELLIQNIQLPELLIPVPVHISKLRERGYNQSWLLTKQLSKLLQIPCTNKLMIKSKPTPSQTSLSLKKRSKNIKQSFKAINKTNVKHIAIIDDVVTTGSTASEMTKILKRNGVDYVQLWGIAQTL